MEYNTSRNHMQIAEYGRHIQKMIEYACMVEDRKERNKLSKSIISVMGQINPHLRDVPDFKHKLYDHLFFMSDFKLDIDSPYPIPTRETIHAVPEKVKYSEGKIRFKYYGKTLESLIHKATEFEEGEEKDALIRLIVMQMKKDYQAWNGDNLLEGVIAEHLRILSDGKILFDEKIRNIHQQEIKTKDNSINNGGQQQNRQNQNKKKFNKNKNNKNKRFKN